MGAHAIGAVSLIEPGCEVWSTTRGRDGVDGEGDQYEPLGGVVVWVSETADDETGEIDRTFLCLDHVRTRPHLRFLVLHESEVDRSTAQAVDPTLLRRLWRRVAEEIAFSRRYHERRGPAVAEEARLALALYELVGLVFGADGILRSALATPQAPERPPAPRHQAPANVAALVD